MEVLLGVTMVTWRRSALHGAGGEAPDELALEDDEER